MTYNVLSPPRILLREFLPEDWPQFVRLMRALHQEGEVKSLRFSERKLLQSLGRPGMFHLMAFDGMEAVGICMGWVEETFFGPDLVGHQHIFYVTPSHRGRFLGPQMMRAWEEWCRMKGAKELWVSQATGIASERTAKLFTRLGYRVLGVIARKGVGE